MPNWLHFSVEVKITTSSQQQLYGLILDEFLVIRVLDNEKAREAMTQLKVNLPVEEIGAIQIGT